MKLSKCFQMAISTIISNKVRSLLTMLGIIIGISSVIILVSLMDGVSRQVTDIFSEMGTSTINVTIKERGGSRAVRAKDVYTFAKENSDLISDVSPMVSMRATVKNRVDSDSIKTNVSGVSEKYSEMKQLKIVQGGFFNYTELERIQNVCVVGAYIQDYFFGKMNSCLGEIIKINGVPFKIIGVLEEKADSAQGTSDEAIYIPYTNAARMTKNAFINSYIIAAKDEETVSQAIKKVKIFLNNVLGSSDYYNVLGMKELLDYINKVNSILKTALVLIAGISLLVGGIGIMNIMLVSVSERTREIGIRKSIGANPKDIMRQFVMEAATISGLGGIIGLILGASLAVGVGKLMDLNTVPSATATIVSVSISVGIGMAFGYFPARKASKLNPIDALRTE